MKNKQVTSSRVTRVAKRKKRFHIIGIIILILISINGYLLYNIGNRYYATSDWKQAKTITMAEQPVSVLYDDNQKSKNNKLKFETLYKKMLGANKDITTTATNKNLTLLKKYLNNMSKDATKNPYKIKYRYIEQKIKIINKYKKLFNKESQIKANITPLTIAKLIKETNGQLSNYYTTDNNDEFVKRIINMQIHLQHDVAIINKISKTYQKAVDIKKSSNSNITLKTSYTGDFAKNVSDAESKLYYEWDGLNKLNEILSLTQSQIDKIQNRHSALSAYYNDKKQESESIIDWKNEKSNYLYSSSYAKSSSIQAKADSESQKKASSAASESARIESEKEASSMRDSSIAESQESESIKQAESSQKIQDSINSQKSSLSAESSKLESEKNSTSINSSTTKNNTETSNASNSSSVNK